MADVEERSRAGGACVLIALGSVLDAVAWAVDEAAGILLLVAAGAVALWRSARRRQDPQPLPSPTAAPTRGDVYAVETGEVARVAEGPGGVRIIHPVIKYVTEPATRNEP